MDNIKPNDDNIDNNALDPRCWNLNFPMFIPNYPLPPRTPTSVDLYPAINNWIYLWTKNRPWGYWMHAREIIAGTLSYAVFGCVLTQNGTTLYVSENFPNIDNFSIFSLTYY